MDDETKRNGIEISLLSTDSQTIRFTVSSTNFKGSGTLCKNFMRILLKKVQLLANFQTRIDEIRLYGQLKNYTKGKYQ